MMTRNEAIACYVGVELETSGLVDVYQHLNDWDGSFPECVVYHMWELDTILGNMLPSEILGRTADYFSIDDDYFYITDKGIITSANEDEVYRHLAKYEDELVAYLQAEEYGHTGNNVLDAIIDADENTHFDSEYVYTWED